MPSVWVDEKAMRQVILNLLSNAVKFTPQGGEIPVKVGWTAGGGQYVSIKDNGPGIPEEEIPVVLSAFGQGSIAIKSAEQGTGLGLPIVQAILAKHDGQFILKSKLREGTEVIAILPAKRVLQSLPAVEEAAGRSARKKELRLSRRSNRSEQMPGDGTKSRDRARRRRSCRAPRRSRDPWHACRRWKSPAKSGRSPPRPPYSSPRPRTAPRNSTTAIMISASVAPTSAKQDQSQPQRRSSSCRKADSLQQALEARPGIAGSGKEMPHTRPFASHRQRLLSRCPSIRLVIGAAIPVDPSSYKCEIAESRRNSPPQASVAEPRHCDALNACW